ncbi:MAG: lipid-A-disaccharide synthase [Ignavibacteria bacterium]|nr:lipid-A-disaccharide synthase [Ignavibacteria bacterium]
MLIVAGEASGDLHGSGVVRELRKRIPSLEIFGIGGDRMRGEGMELLYHITAMSFMGFAEVVRNIRFIRSVEQRIARELSQRRPDVVVLIDYPGFNLRLARRARRAGIKVLYYISPQVWAWHKSRVHKMRSCIDTMKVVFPFEVDIYRDAGLDVEFVGHPLVEHIGSSLSREEFRRHYRIAPDKKLLALVPGSRAQEISTIFPTMIRVAENLRTALDVEVAVGVAPNLGVEALQAYLPQASPIRCVEHATYDLMAHADAAIVTSGTATLETGWFGTPMAVVYKTSPITFFIGRMLVDVANIGMVNIVAGKTVVPEFIQNEMTVANLEEAVGRMLRDQSYADHIRHELAVIKTKLGTPGASRRVAESIIRLAEAA